MRLSVIAVKLTNGRELLCGIPEDLTVQFGILEYPNKIPRKTFVLLRPDDAHAQNKHTLTVYEAFELYAGPNTLYLHPMLISNPMLGRGKSPLTLHSNDVFALSTAVDPQVAHLWMNQSGQVDGAQSPQHFLTNVSN